MKKIFLGIIALFAAVVMVACTNNKGVQTVNLTVWASELQQEFTQTLINEFVEANKETVNLVVKLGPVSEAQTYDEYIKDPAAAADLFAFPDDQFVRFRKIDALQEVGLNTQAIIEANGGAEAGVVKAASENGKLYAYPMTADNGYFMYYDKSVYTAEQVLSLDSMLEVAKADGSVVSMNLNSGWYNYSFFAGAGLLTDDTGENTQIAWNSAVGLQVAKAMIRINAHDGFTSEADSNFIGGLEEGRISAAVNGAWSAAEAQRILGENFAATKLPTYNLNGQQVQMSSFAGYKLIGVNKLSKSPVWASRLSEYLTNEANQLRRFERHAAGPSNVKVAASPAVQANPAIAALVEQSVFAYTQSVKGNYWAPTEAFGTIITTGGLNPNSTDAQIQTELDKLVSAVNNPVAQ